MLALLTLAFGTVHGVRLVKRAAGQDEGLEAKAASKCLAFVANEATPEAMCGGPPLGFDVDQPVYCRIRRICEILESAAPNEVWNTIGCNDCAPEIFRGVSAAGSKVGPVYLLPDYFRMVPPPEGVDGSGNRIVKTWTGPAGSVAMMKVAVVVKLPFLRTFGTISRRSMSRWRPGRQVYQFELPDGAVFTMSWSSEEFPDPVKIQASFPVGLNLRCKVVGCSGFELEAPNGIANISTDTLGNLYEWTPEGPSDCPRFLDRSCEVESEASRVDMCANPPAECSR